MRRIATALLALAASMASVAHAAPPPMQTVESVDLKRYAGMWYEIANFPMVFQRNCVGDTTAEYTLHPDGSVGVNNRCRNKDGEVDSASGTATVVEGSNNAKLEVTPCPLQGRLLDHRPDPEYRWAVVGTPDRKYLWILSRSPQLPQEELDRALAAAKAQGYQLDELRYTPQK